MFFNNPELLACKGRQGDGSTDKGTVLMSDKAPDMRTVPLSEKFALRGSVGE